MEKKSTGKKAGENLAWWQLSLIGIGCTIGTGFFLGSSIGIRMTGPSIVFSFMLAALATYIVYDALAAMTVDHPEKGSFRTYAKKAYGRWAGFSSGWVYWSSETLITGSQITALSLFAKFWFPDLPLWVFSIFFGVLGLVVLLTGVNGFERLENVLAVAKFAAIVMFIVIAGAALLGFIDGGGDRPGIPGSIVEYFPNGFKGFSTALIFSFYAFGGIEVLGLMASKLKNKEDAPKAGSLMLLVLMVIYVLSIGLALMLVSWKTFKTDESPFVIVLEGFKIPYMSDVFNGVFIIAGFSTLAAALFAVTTILVTLSEDGDAPKLFSKKTKKEIPLFAIGLTAGGLAAASIVSLLLPEKVYEYVTTAASLMILYNWAAILMSVQKVIDLKSWGHIKRIFGFLLIAFAIGGSMFDKVSRIGFFISIGFLFTIILVTYIMTRIWKRAEKA
ncbi:amino acid permease [Bacillus marinisedimentorum]|uniref:amino acid permease n=1 Tax=Bacillus marinisedimentorum TaxID=1821260 RepID=UPI000871E805|nr:amino acid permease [Bacillus marinisedimentorum]